MATLKKLYSDIDLSFIKTPGRNDVALSYDEMAVIRSVRFLLLTKPFERPFQHNLGSNLGQLLFEPISPVTASSINREILATLNNYEPRVTVSQITISEKPDNNAYDVSILFYIGNNTTPTEIKLILERNR